MPLGLGAFLTLSVLALALLFRATHSASAQVPWPTPPPAPVQALAQVIPVFQITPVPAPARPGALAAQIDPIAGGPVPRVPPQPFAPLVAGGPSPEQQVTFEIPAGSMDRTLQFTYEPLVLGEAPQAPSDLRLQRVFRLLTFDHTARPASIQFRRPVRLLLRPTMDELQAAGNDPARLLLAWFDPERNRWLPLVTTFDATQDTVMARILKPGLLALAAVPPPLTP